MNDAATQLQAEASRLYARCCHLLDDGDADGWSQLFEPTLGTFSPDEGSRIVGRDALRDFARNREHRGKKHLTLNIWAEESGPGRITGRADYVILRAEPLSVVITYVGGYVDVLCRVDGALAFETRTARALPPLSSRPPEPVRIE